MITLLTTDAAKTPPNGATTAAVPQLPEMAESFAVMVAGNKASASAALSAVTAVDGIVSDADVQPVPAPDVTSAEDIDALIAPHSVPDKVAPPAARIVETATRGRAARDHGAVSPQITSGRSPTIQDDGKLGSENAAGRLADTQLPRGVSTAQSMVEGWIQSDAKLPKNAAAKPGVDGPPSSLKSDFAPQALIPEKRGGELIAATTERTVVPPEVGAASAVVRSLQQPDHVEKRKDTKERSVTNLVPAPIPNTSPSVSSQPVKPIHAQVHAAGGERREQDGKSFDRELSLGSMIQDRPVTASGGATHATASPAGEMARSVTQQLAVAVSHGSGKTTEIALNPEELGRVRLTLTANDGVLTLTVLAERPETQDLLRRNIEMLAQDFRTLGYQDLTFSFGAEGQGPESEMPEPEHATVQAKGGDNGPENEYSGPHLGPGLDLRL